MLRHRVLKVDQTLQASMPGIENPFRDAVVAVRVTALARQKVCGQTIPASVRGRTPIRVWTLTESFFATASCAAAPGRHSCVEVATFCAEESVADMNKIVIDHDTPWHM